MISPTRKDLTQLYMILSISPMNDYALISRLQEIFEADTQADLISALSGLVEKSDRLSVIASELEKLGVMACRIQDEARL